MPSFGISQKEKKTVCKTSRDRRSQHLSKQRTESKQEHYQINKLPEIQKNLHENFFQFTGRNFKSRETNKRGKRPKFSFETVQSPQKQVFKLSQKSRNPPRPKSVRNMYKKN